MNIIDFKGPDARIGLVARNGTSGPEADLVDEFKRYIPGCFRWRRGDVAIFHEPRLETGFPDLVVVQYLPQAFNNWPIARSKLGTLEIKIMQHLIHKKAADLNELVVSIGIDSSRLIKILEKLVDAKMVNLIRKKWKPLSLSKIFGVQTIVSIEAKIKNWSEAFQQASLNHWFSSESYILSPIEKPRPRVIKRSKKIGVGVLLLNGTRVRRPMKALKHRIPASYGSWMFNEWIGRRMHGEQRNFHE